MKEHQTAVLRYFGELKPGSVLDACAGRCEFAGPLEEMGFKVFSMDAFETPGSVKRFVRADANAPFPYAPASFDYVLCSESLQYLENHRMLFREFKRVLRPSGSVVLSLPNVLSAASRSYFLRRGYFRHFKPMRTADASKSAWDSFAYNPVSIVDVADTAGAYGLELRDVKASSLRYSGIFLGLWLKLCYSIGLMFEKNGRKASLLRHVSSWDALFGDHVILRLEQA